MGKIRETFRLVNDDGTASPTLEQPTSAVVDVDVSDNVPFIEIGPRRHVEMSPDVSACPPAPRRAATTPVPSVRSVTFRNLPAVRHPETRSQPRFAPELIAYHSPNLPASYQYADLLATTLEAGRGRGGQTQNAYLFTGVRPGAGTTTVMLNLAITAARRDTRVVVVDTNLRRSALAERVGIDVAPGLTEVLNGEIALSDALRATAQENLQVLTAGSPAAIWADAVSLGDLLRELTGMTDLVFIDGPAWDGRGAAAGLASLCEAVFLVVPSREADNPPATELLASLAGKGVPLAGCILTES